MSHAKPYTEACDSLARPMENDVARALRGIGWAIVALCDEMREIRQTMISGGEAEQAAEILAKAMREGG